MRSRRAAVKREVDRVRWESWIDASMIDPLYPAEPSVALAFGGKGFPLYILFVEASVAQTE
jgi:hypothetical protein